MPNNDRSESVEAHKTEDNYCCACEYDLVVVEDVIESRVAAFKQQVRNKILEGTKNFSTDWPLEGKKIMYVDDVLQILDGE